MLTSIMDMDKRKGLECKYHLQSGQNVTGVLNKLVQIDNGAATTSLFLEEHLQLPQFIECTHI